MIKVVAVLLSFLGLLNLNPSSLKANSFQYDNYYMIVSPHALATITAVRYNGSVRWITSHHVCDVGTPFIARINNEDVEFIAKLTDLSMHLCEMVPTSEIKNIVGFNISRDPDLRSLFSYGFGKGIRSFSIVENCALFPLEGAIRAILGVTPLYRCSGQLMPGMSGGPALDKNGELAGINTAGSQIDSLFVTGETVLNFLERIK